MSDIDLKSQAHDFINDNRKKLLESLRVRTPVSTSAIAKRANLSYKEADQDLGRMEEWGWVKSSPVPMGGRCWSMTQKGRTALAT